LGQLLLAEFIHNFQQRYSNTTTEAISSKSPFELQHSVRNEPLDKQKSARRG
jgi:hypothetical protein